MLTECNVRWNPQKAHFIILFKNKHSGIKENSLVACLFVDIPEAFDTVNHDN